LKTRPIIAIDQDDVVAELLKKWLATYNELYGDNLRKEDVLSWDVSEWVKPKCGNRIYEILSTHKFYRDLEVVKDSQEVIEWLQENYEVYFVTNAMFTRESFKSKWDWLRENFPFVSESHIVFCADKSIIKADYLIDDGPHNLKTFDGIGLLYDCAHNRNVSEFRRVNNWEDIRQYFGNILEINRRLSEAWNNPSKLMKENLWTLESEKISEMGQLESQNLVLGF
jgi:5'(3')-deoxyribonucleotidase